jgi:outer membrane receptor for ferrienterochelin and colicins
MRKQLRTIIENKSRLMLPGFLLITLLFDFGMAQSSVRLSGQVLDAQKGNPLYNAVIVVEDTPFGAYSDQNGQFQIENIAPGLYNVKISSLGYKPQQISNIKISEDFPQRLVINLNPQAIETEPLIVESQYLRNQVSLEGDKVVISGKDLTGYRSLGLPQLLQQVAGIQIESTGSSGSQTSVRIHGSRSSQVLILLDGQRLNNPQTGEVDLSQIQMEQIERIEIVRQGNTALFGAGAFDGIISFTSSSIPGGKYVSFQGLGGSFETAMANLTASANISSIGGLIAYQQGYSQQNFEYTYQDQRFLRENAWYRNQAVFGKLNWHLEKTEGNFLYNHRGGNRGLPCAYFNECGEMYAEMQDNIHTAQLNQRYYFSSKNFVEGILGYHRLSQLFNNEDDPVRLNRYKTDQTNENIDVKLQSRFSTALFSELRIGGQFLNERLKQKNLLYPQFSIGEKSRESKGVFGGVEVPLPELVRIWQSVNLRSSVRYEKYFNQPWEWYPNLGFSFIPEFWTSLTMSAGWFRAVRYPDFNSLFWKGDSRAQGNPELFPEKKEGWNVSANIHPEQGLLPSIHIFYYSENIEDLIYWHRSFTGVWEPRNEELAKKKGVDVEIRQPIVAEHLSVQLAYSYIDAINKTEEVNRFDNRIVFIPEHTLNTTLFWQIERLQSQVIYRYVSNRETVFANSQGTQLADYKIWDFVATYLFPLSRIDLEFALALKNLTNTDYQLIYGYPMPGREIQFTFSLKFKS